MKGEISDMNFKAYVLKTFRVEGLVEMAQPALFTDFIDL